MMTATKRMAAVAVMITTAAVSNTTTAQTWCEITGFQVHVAGATSAYVGGNIDGVYKRIFLCRPDGTCDNRTTDQRLSLAISAQMAGKSLWVYSNTHATCAAVPDWYNAPHELMIKP